MTRALASKFKMAVAAPQFALIIALLSWPAIAVAECDFPSASSSNAEIAAFMECMTEEMHEAVARVAAARDAMAARLRNLYLILDGEAELRLDDNQKAWRTATDGSCPPMTTDVAVMIAASKCEEKRYSERSAFLDEILAGCRAGACPIDKL